MNYFEPFHHLLQYSLIFFFFSHTKKIKMLNFYHDPKVQPENDAFLTFKFLIVMTLLLIDDYH